MLLGGLLYVVFTGLASTGAYLAVGGARGARAGAVAAACTLAFFVLLFVLLHALVLSQL